MVGSYVILFCELVSAFRETGLSFRSSVEIGNDPIWILGKCYFDKNSTHTGGCVCGVVYVLVCMVHVCV